MIASLSTCTTEAGSACNSKTAQQKRVCGFMGLCLWVYSMDGWITGDERDRDRYLETGGTEGAGCQVGRRCR